MQTRTQEEKGRKAALNLRKLHYSVCASCGIPYTENKAEPSAKEIADALELCRLIFDVEKKEKELSR